MTIPSPHPRPSPESGTKKRRRLPGKRLERAIEIAREVYGDAARVTVSMDGAITIEKGPEDKAKKRAVTPEKDFVL